MDLSITSSKTLGIWFHMVSHGWTTRNEVAIQPSWPRMVAGTLLQVPGLTSILQFFVKSYANKSASWRCEAACVAVHTVRHPVSISVSPRYWCFKTDHFGVGSWENQPFSPCFCSLHAPKSQSWDTIEWMCTQNSKPALNDQPLLSQQLFVSSCLWRLFHQHDLISTCVPFRAHLFITWFIWYINDFRPKIPIAKWLRRCWGVFVNLFAGDI